jgi:magnesium-transporting ATPase (P-type)
MKFILGVEGLVKNLRTNIEKGLSPDDLEDRVKHFGTNRKEPPERTPYWQFFIKAIDDFMLKLLLVCACVDIGFGVGFAAPEDRSHGKLLLSDFESLIFLYKNF